MKPGTDNLGDRMKAYEKNVVGQLMPLLPAIARLDGRAFHTFTRGLERPYDKRLSHLMASTTRHMVENFDAKIGYTQSDEITLIWKSDDPKSQLPFDGKVFKMVSLLAAEATRYFNLWLETAIPEKSDRPATFDCRVWNVPTAEEAANVLIWREQDATRNSISMAAQSVYSHSQLHKKSCREMQDMIHEKGINWNDYPDSFKRGTYIRRSAIETAFTASEIDKLPEKHEARRNPDMKVLRHVTGEVQMPIFSTVVNRVDVIFGGAEPEVSKATPPRPPASDVIAPLRPRHPCTD